MKKVSPDPLLRSSSLFAVFIVSMLLIVGQSAGHAQLASAISPAPTNTVVSGEIVWADLVTTDVETAIAFYARVFGWEILRSDDPGYVELAHDGDVICAVAKFDDDDITPGNARWLVSISVADVDEVAANVERHGGSVLEAPEDFPDRGRFAVVSDSQDAVFVLLRASGGDPSGDGHVADAWGGRPTVRYSVGYGSYYGGSPWGYYPGHPVYVGGGGRPDIPDIPDGPVAAPMPDFGMPDAGGMDFGGFDDF